MSLDPGSEVLNQVLHLSSGAFAGRGLPLSAEASSRPKTPRRLPKQRTSLTPGNRQTTHRAAYTRHPR